jgi:hypothetical protein
MEIEVIVGSYTYAAEAHEIDGVVTVMTAMSS